MAHSTAKLTKKEKGKSKRKIAAVESGRDGEDIIDTTKRQFTRATRRNGDSQALQAKVSHYPHNKEHD